nr:uncharacterized protein LOC111419169 [Onthophagus taurus]
MLTFLNKVDHKRESISNLQCDNTVIEDDNASTGDECLETGTCNAGDDSSIGNPIEHSLQPLLKRPRKRDKIVELMEARRNEREQIIKTLTQNKEDEIDVFFRSIAMSVKKLKPELINEAKMRSLQLIFELEQRNEYLINSQIPSTSTIYSSSTPTLSSLGGDSVDYNLL